MVALVRPRLKLRAEIDMYDILYLYIRRIDDTLDSTHYYFAQGPVITILAWSCLIISPNTVFFVLWHRQSIPRRVNIYKCPTSIYLSCNCANDFSQCFVEYGNGT